MEDLAKERVADKNAYGNSSYSPSTNDKFSLLHMYDVVGIDLGCSIEMVEHNLEIIEKMEQVRKDFYIQNIADKKDIQEPSSLGPIGTGGTDISELCSDNDHSDAEVDSDAEVKRIIMTT